MHTEPERAAPTTVAEGEPGVGQELLELWEPHSVACAVPAVHIHLVWRKYRDGNGGRGMNDHTLCVRVCMCMCVGGWVWVYVWVYACIGQQLFELWEPHSVACAVPAVHIHLES